MLICDQEICMSTQVRMRPYWAQWRYKLDVLVDQEPIYFDRYPQKIQHFPGVTVYTPSNILNQSHVIAMFQVITVRALGACFRAKLWTPPTPLVPCLHLAQIFSRINQPPPYYFLLWAFLFPRGHHKWKPPFSDAIPP